MKSSYENSIAYADIFALLMVEHHPKLVVEFGILKGYSLQQFAKYKLDDCELYAFDIFSEFNGNHADEEMLKLTDEEKKVYVCRGDFYKCGDKFDTGVIDLLHVDIANNGNVYQYAIENWLDKLSQHGVMILEGGSKERDTVEWMIKYNKRPIKPYIDELKSTRSDLRIITIGCIPSITIIFKNNI